MKRLYLFSIRSFAGPFIVTLVISMFILILQFFWVYMDDLMGKGLSIWVILELLFYVSANLIPLALPLAILLSSLMTFGSFAENNELTALKSSGLSLYRIMRPLMVIVTIISISTFYFANYVIPVFNLKFHTLIYDIQNTKISSILTPGVYTKDFAGYSIKVKSFNDTVYKGITIHDYSHPTELKTVKANEARIYKSANGQYMFFDLKNGRILEELDIQNPLFLPDGTVQNHSGRPARVSYFEHGTYKLNIAGFNLSRTDEDLFTDKYEMMNVFQISTAMDSLEKKKSQVLETFAKNIGKEFVSFNDKIMYQDPNTGLSNVTVPIIDYQNLNAVDKLQARNTVISRLRRTNETIENQDQFILVMEKESDLYWIEFHKKLALTYAVIVLFFVGGPLGAIIRKGGFGTPVVVAALTFMVYFMLNSIGQNLAETNTVSPFIGMWLAGFFFTPVAWIITRAAANDAQVFSKEMWNAFALKIIRKNARTRT
ncbi:MAG: LptF/LptG family permease [Crocinitomicaceae bacterium]|nr:LptF/LptG family permease [Crocinitomicaceae bacterium]MDP4761587.1 LptF/LptG family permease [Crocinitomicaceae bacterium]